MNALQAPWQAALRRLSSKLEGSAAKLTRPYQSFMTIHCSLPAHPSLTALHSTEYDLCMVQKVCLDKRQLHCPLPMSTKNFFKEVNPLCFFCHV